MKQFIILTLLFCSFQGYAQKTVKGYVFEDANHNSVRDNNEQGIAGVGVSNGIEIAITDKNGYYELPAYEPMIVFVIKPTGYRIPVDSINLPKFYYIHKPHGSPPLNVSGSAPTGPLPERVNFPLNRYDEPEEYKIIVFGDTQAFDWQLDYLKRGVVNNLIGVQGYAFGLTLGDDGFDPPLHLGRISRIIGQIGIPWYHLIGNHDHNYDATDDKTASETFESFYGPVTYSFNYGKVHYIVADNTIHRPNDNKAVLYNGGLREDQMQFLENDLRHVPDDYLVIFMAHIPLFDVVEEELYDGERVHVIFRHKDRDRIFAALAKFPHTLSLSGHTHYIRQHFFDASENWPGAKPHHHLNAGAVCGSWWLGLLDQYNLPGAMMRCGSPQGYFTLSFSDNQYVYDFHAIHIDTYRQISLFRKDSFLYANFFTGNQYSQLAYRINDGAWQPMQQTKMETDPWTAAIRKQWDDVAPNAKVFDKVEGLPGLKPPEPRICTHLWKAKVNWSSFDKVEVQATDMYGRIFKQAAVYEQ